MPEFPKDTESHTKESSLADQIRSIRFAGLDIFEKTQEYTKDKSEQFRTAVYEMALSALSGIDKDVCAHRIKNGGWPWTAAVDLAESFEYAATIHDGTPSTIKNSWVSQSSNLLESGPPVDAASVELMENVAERYISSGLFSKTFEKAICSRMAFSEVQAFRETFNLPYTAKSKTIIWHLVKSTGIWIVGAIASISIADSYGLALGLLAFMVWTTCHSYLHRLSTASLKERLEILSHMIQAYKVLQRRESGYESVENALRISENHAVVWPSRIRDVLEHSKENGAAHWLRTGNK